MVQWLRQQFLVDSSANIPLQQKTETEPCFETLHLRISLDDRVQDIEVTFKYILVFYMFEIFLAG
jgi:hypothetical protein